MNVRYRVTLNDDKRTELQALATAGRSQVREVKRAQIPLLAAEGLTEEQIAKAVHAGAATTYRTKRSFVEEGVDAALHEAQRPGGRRKVSRKEEALLIATACSAPSIGQARWRLDLLAGEMVRLTLDATRQP